RKLALQTKDTSEPSRLPDLAGLTEALSELKDQEPAPSEPFINTPLQRGETNTEEPKTVFNSFPCAPNAQEIARKTPDISHIADLSMPDGKGSILNAQCISRPEADPLASRLSPP